MTPNRAEERTNPGEKRPVYASGIRLGPDAPRRRASPDTLGGSSRQW